MYNGIIGGKGVAPFRLVNKTSMLTVTSTAQRGKIPLTVLMRISPHVSIYMGYL